MMKYEVDLSRRKFLKFGGLLGLTLGALSLPSLGRIESTTDAGSEIGQELWLEAKSKKKKKASGKKKKSTSEGSHTDWQEIA
jgi:hypothetical protein